MHSRLHVYMDFQMHECKFTNHFNVVTVVIIKRVCVSTDLPNHGLVTFQ